MTFESIRTTKKKPASRFRLPLPVVVIVSLLVISAIAAFFLLGGHHTLTPAPAHPASVVAQAKTPVQPVAPQVASVTLLSSSEVIARVPGVEPIGYPALAATTTTPSNAAIAGCTNAGLAADQRTARQARHLKVGHDQMTVSGSPVNVTAGISYWRACRASLSATTSNTSAAAAFKAVSALAYDVRTSNGRIRTVSYEDEAVALARANNRAVALANRLQHSTDAPSDGFALLFGFGLLGFAFACGFVVRHLTRGEPRALGA